MLACNLSEKPQGDSGFQNLDFNNTSNSQISSKARLTSTMGYSCCGPPAPAPEPDVTPIAAPTDEMSGYQDSCCDRDHAKPLHTTAPGQAEPTQENLVDCCSPGKCTDNKIKNDTDAPDCCRGKVSPCCDTSCLDRLAMRECEMSAAATPGPNGQPTSE
jgi:Cu2+-exporting ATPase